MRVCGDQLGFPPRSLRWELGCHQVTAVCLQRTALCCTRTPPGERRMHTSRGPIPDSPASVDRSVFSVAPSTAVAARGHQRRTTWPCPGRQTSSRVGTQQETTRPNQPVAPDQPSDHRWPAHLATKSPASHDLAPGPHVHTALPTARPSAPVAPPHNGRSRRPAGDHLHPLPT